jgi:hypothetical protein
MELPSPPVPSACDLRRYSWIPVPVSLVRDSTWWLTASDAAQAAQLRLMVASWHQVPAASLPDDDRLLAKLGRISSKVIRCLTEIRKEWTLCTDGRLYHPELAEIALDSWEKMQSQAARTAAARAARAQKRGSVTEDVTGSTRQDKTREGEEREKTAHRLPAEWWPNAEEIKFAESLGLDPERTADDFRDHWHEAAGATACRIEWSGAWRKWCRGDNGATF